MINCGKTRQSGPTVQSHDSGRTKLCAGFRFVQFLIWEMVSVVVAGIAVPSVLWSHAAKGPVLVAGSLQRLTLGRISFWYTRQDVEFAILGTLLGTAVAWALYAPSKFAGKARVGHTLQQIHWKRFLWLQGHWRAGVRKAA
jgi:hypothetical protein